MSSKRKTLTGFTDREPAPESYMGAVGFGLEKKNAMNRVGILLGSHKRQIANHYRKAYAAKKKKEGKLGRYTPPHGKRFQEARQAANQAKPVTQTEGELTVS